MLSRLARGCAVTWSRGLLAARPPQPVAPGVSYGLAARSLSQVPLLPREAGVLRAMRDARRGSPLPWVPGSPVGGEVVVKRVDRFGRRRVRGRRGMSKRVIWIKQVVKGFYYNLSTSRLHRMVRKAVRSGHGFAQSMYFQLESRLDIFLRRVLFVPSLPAARHCIHHGFILVNGRPAKSASHILSYGDVVQVADHGLIKLRRQFLEAKRLPLLKSRWQNPADKRPGRFHRKPFWGQPFFEEWSKMYDTFCMETGVEQPGQQQRRGRRQN